MRATANFMGNFFPLFLLGGVFGKLMADSGAAILIAQGIVEWLGKKRAVIAVVIACAVLTYGGVSLFVVAFAVMPVAAALFEQANIPQRLIPAAIALGAFTFTMTALPGTPAIQNAIPMAFFHTTLFAAPVLGVIASAIMLGFGLWWLRLIATRASEAGEGYSPETQKAVDDPLVRARGANCENFDIAELEHGHPCKDLPSFAASVAPIAIVLVVNLLTSLFVLPRMDTGYLAEPRFGAKLSAVSGVWSVVVALALASLVLVSIYRKRLTELQKTLMPAPPLRYCLCSIRQVWSVSVLWLRRCLLLLWSETTFCRFQAGRSFDRHCRQCNGRHHRFGLRRIDHRAQCAGRNICTACLSRGRSSRVDAPRSRYKLRRARHAAA